MLTHDSILAWLRTKAGVTISQNDRENRRLASEFLKMMVDASVKQTTLHAASKSEERRLRAQAPEANVVNVGGGLLGKFKRAVSGPE